MLLGCRLMVGQEILVLFIMVRIRALQPKIQPAFAGFIFGRARMRQNVNGTETYRLKTQFSWAIAHKTCMAKTQMNN